MFAIYLYFEQLWDMSTSTGLLVTTPARAATSTPTTRATTAATARVETTTPGAANAKERFTGAIATAKERFTAEERSTVVCTTGTATERRSAAIDTLCVQTKELRVRVEKCRAEFEFEERKAECRMMHVKLDMLGDRFTAASERCTAAIAKCRALDEMFDRRRNELAATATTNRAIAVEEH